MRLHYVSGSTIPSHAANSVHVMRMCRALSRCRHDLEVTLHGRKQGGASVSDAELFSHYGMDPAFRLNLSPIVRLPRVSGVLRVTQTLTDVLRRAGPGVLYGRDVYALFLASCLSDVPVFFEAHHMPASRFQEKILHWLIRRPNFGGMVVISGPLRDDMLVTFPELSSQHVLTAHDGADLPDEEVVSCDLPAWADLPGGRMQVGYTGSVLPGRGIDLLLDIAERLPDCDFHFVGGTTDQVAKWQFENKTDGAHGNVFFHGAVPNAQIPGILARFDVLVAPYQRKVQISQGMDTARWMSPMKVFEYMAAGRAIVMSDIEVLKEVVDDEKTALLVAPEKTDAWVRALRRLSEDQDFRKRLGCAAQAHLKEHFTWDIRARNILRFVEERVGAASSTG